RRVHGFSSTQFYSTQAGVPRDRLTKGFEKTGDWLSYQWGGRQKILCCRQSRCRCPHDQSHRGGDKADDNQRRLDEKVDLEVPPYRRPRVAAAELSLRRRELCAGPVCPTGRDAMDGATARTDESGRCQGAAEYPHLRFLRQQLRRGTEAIGVLRKSLEVSTGYSFVTLNAPRLSWLMAYGVWPMVGMFQLYAISYQPYAQYARVAGH